MPPSSRSRLSSRVPNRTCGDLSSGRRLPYAPRMIRDEVKALVEGKNFATVSTLLPSGQIQTHVVWIDCDDDHIVINTEVALDAATLGLE